MLCFSLESPQRGDSNEYTQHILLCRKSKKKTHKLSLFAFWPDTMWLEIPMSRTIFYGPNDVRAIAVRMYFVLVKKALGRDT